MSTAFEITAQAKSNLAFALKIIPKGKRHDMIAFYAFCRKMDDLADDNHLPFQQRLNQLSTWKEGIIHGFKDITPFQQEVVQMQKSREIPTEYMVAIIDGCLMDMSSQRFLSWEDLQIYTWKVSCVVGIISTQLFGCKDPLAKDYAIALGHALQLTNIIRDVGEDLSNDMRIYLPLNDMIRFQYSERDLVGRVHDGRFVAMMRYHAERAESYFFEADRILSKLPKEDIHALLPARIMADIYYELLQKIRHSRFHVFHQRHKVSKMQKLLILSKYMIGSKLSLFE